MPDREAATNQYPIMHLLALATRRECGQDSRTKSRQRRRAGSLRHKSEIRAGYRKVFTGFFAGVARIASRPGGLCNRRESPACHASMGTHRHPKR